MQVAYGVEMLEISATIMGKVDVVHPTLAWDEDAVILMDTGYPGQLPLLREAMEKAGVPLDKLTAVIVTHQDLDHFGCLPAIRDEMPRGVEVLASEVERPYIQGDKRLLKWTPEIIAQTIDSLPAEVPEAWRIAFRAVLENPPKAAIDKTVADGEELPYCGGITVIGTPGHTPGHICLYHKASRTLVAGDAMRVVDGRLVGPEPPATLDMKLAIQSLKKLARYDVETVVCHHGGLYRDGVNQRIAELAVIADRD